jgi:hypothetical protein
MEKRIRDRTWIDAAMGSSAHRQARDCILHGAGAEVWSICICTTCTISGERILYMFDDGP